ncbi:MAG: NAD+ synthase [Balneolaceae bacterium]
MQIRLEQLNPIIGDIDGNKEKILSSLRIAEKEGIDLLVLPELGLTGYPVQDLLEKEFFRNYCYQANDEIIKKTGKTALLFGSITPNEKPTGRKMNNSALLAKDGELLNVTHKTLLPTYDVFDDLRYFEPNRDFEYFELDGVKLGVTICEDIWYNENELQYHIYDIDPAKKMKESGAELIINISASPFTKTKHENRKYLLGSHAKRLNLPVLYCNQVGAHTDLVFEGDSMAFSAEGKLIANTKPFEPSFTDLIFDKEGGTVKQSESSVLQKFPESKEERTFKAIKLGLRDYVEKTGIGKKVVLGLSGGIDSALVAALAVETLGAKNVKAITMPSTFSSEGSVSDSEILSQNLGIELYNIPIKEIYNQFDKSLHPLFNDLPFDTAEENLQSRIRGTLLMAYSNKFGNFLLATGNKSEFAVGYATLYGDMNGAISIIGDLYKTEVFDLAKWMNRSHYQKEVIPESIIQKPPSAELRPDQKDVDSLPEYELLDQILYSYIEEQMSAKEIAEKTGEPKVVNNVVSLVDRNEFKRFQAPPTLKLSAKSFGSGRRWPIVQKWTGIEF